MIKRYSRPKIEKIWSLENKYALWLKIECLIAEKLSLNNSIPKDAAEDIIKKSNFNTKEIEKIEEETKHDFVAFINNVSSYIGENSKFFHFGVTSSDIIDTAFSIQLKESADIIIEEIKLLLETIKIRSLEHKNSIMIGRTHGMHAEPTTFGLKLASFYYEFKRGLNRLIIAKDEISICTISGPVGTYENIDQSIEKYVGEKLDLIPENVSTQIIPRDRHAFFFSTLGIIASSIERLAIEIRLLQKTEVSEVEEFFSTKQTGSSAMPHKRNPILSENLTGLSRYIRSSIIPFMENISLWHERDISHSSVERILAPDITIATDFTLSRLNKIIKNLKIYPENMKKNLDKHQGLHNSHNLLLKLIEKGISRQKAYEIIQSSSMKTLDSNEKFEDILLKNENVTKYLTVNELKNLFSNKKLINIDKIFNNLFK